MLPAKSETVAIQLTSISQTLISKGTVKPLLVATSIKQETRIKQACIHFPKEANSLKCTCIKQASVLSKHILIIS